MTIKAGGWGLNVENDINIISAYVLRKDHSLQSKNKFLCMKEPGRYITWLSSSYHHGWGEVDLQSPPMSCTEESTDPGWGVCSVNTGSETA